MQPRTTMITIILIAIVFIASNVVLPLYVIQAGY